MSTISALQYTDKKYSQDPHLYNSHASQVGKVTEKCRWQDVFKAKSNCICGEGFS